MNYQTVIDKIKKRLKKRWEKEGSGHDYYHLKRVVRNAHKIADQEGGNVALVLLSAWLHDSFDDKIIKEAGKEKNEWRKFLQKEKVPDKIIDQVYDIIEQVSFRKNKGKIPYSLEAKIVQDADRLDAMGAVGIARTFAFGGSRNRPIYNDFEIPNSTKQIPDSDSTLAHFYEKLLHLQSLLNTETAKKMGTERHEFMLQFLEQFYKESR